MSNKELASKIGVHEVSLSRIKRKREFPRLDADYLDKLCEALDCDLGDLMERT